MSNDLPPVARTYTDQPRLHQREEVATAPAAYPISRYRVPGGWLYQARESGSVALAFVPDSVQP